MALEQKDKAEEEEKAKKTKENLSIYIAEVDLRKVSNEYLNKANLRTLLVGQAPLFNRNTDAPQFSSESRVHGQRSRPELC